MNFFKTKAKTPPELIKSIRDLISRLDSSNSSPEIRRKVNFVDFFSHSTACCRFSPFFFFRYEEY